MSDLLLPLLYVFLFGNIIYRARFFNITQGRTFLLTIFVIKCVLSALYWIMHMKDYGGGDTYYYFLNAEIIGKTLEHGPWKYLHLVFGFNGGHMPPDIEPDIRKLCFWFNTSEYMVVRFNALVYLFSFGNPYVHGIFMSFISLTGLTALYRGIIRVSANQNRSLIRFAIFGIPSVLFWTSGVHKEGLIIFGLGFFFYGFLSIRPGARNWKYVNMIILSSIFIFLIRDFVFYLLLPGMFAYQASKVFPRLGPLFIVGVYAFLVLAAPYLNILPGNKNYMQIISEKQSKFKQVEMGNTNFNLPDFQPGRESMIKQLPGALFNTTIRPSFIGLTPMSHAIIFMENLFLLLIALLCILFFNVRTWHYSPLMAWMFGFGLSLLALIGYIVPNVGAIIRYRSIALPFVFVPLLYYIKPALFEKVLAFPGRLLNSL